MKQKQSLLKNPWILALLLLGISFGTWFIAFILLIGPIALGLLPEELLESMGRSAGIVAPMFLGYIYAFKFKETMPKNLRIEVLMIYLVPQFILVLLILFVLAREIFAMIWFVPITVLLLVICFAGMYFMIGAGGKSYAKALEKAKRARGKNGAKM